MLSPSVDIFTFCGEKIAITVFDEEGFLPGARFRFSQDLIHLTGVIAPSSVLQLISLF